MITEDYVSFEVAKLLKEKGFDGIVINSYDNYTLEFLPHCAKHYGQTNAPTLQMAMKWLREVHGIHFFPDPFLTKEGRVGYGRVYILDTNSVGFIYENLEKNTYEEACEAAIKYCLENLI